MNQNHYHHAKLSEARTGTGKTMQAVATDLKVDRQTIYRAEAGIIVSYEILALLCSYYKIPMTEIVIEFPEVAAHA